MTKRRRSPKLAAAAGSSFQERRSERVAIDESTELRHRFAVDVMVRDVSTRGFMAECDQWVQIGSTVSLDVAGLGSVEAQVRWQIGNRMGGMFLDPISLERCEWTATRCERPALQAC